MVVKTFNRRVSSQLSGKHVEFTLCNGRRHYDVDICIGNTSFCSVSEECDEISCLRTKELTTEEILELPDQVLRYTELTVPVSDGVVLITVSGDDSHDCLIHDSGQDVPAVSYRNGKKLQEGETFDFQITTTVGHKREYYRIKNNSGKSEITDIAKENRRDFARSQLQRLRQLGFDHNQTYQLIGLVGPAEATVAAEYAYLLIDRGQRDSSQLIELLQNLLSIIEVNKDTDIAAINKLFAAMNLPAPETQNAVIAHKILMGAKLIFKFGLPGRKVRRAS